MSATSPADPLTLGQHLVNVLDTGSRVATYKLAVLVALLEFSVENVPDDHSSSVDVDLDDLAERVVGLYWRQVRGFDGHYLRQSTQAKATIPDTVREFARTAATAGRETPLDIASRKNPDRLSSLLKPALMLAWADDVRRKNSFLNENVPDLDGRMFGSDRVALARPRAALIEAFGPSCSTVRRARSWRPMSITCFRGRGWGSTVSRTWCWHAPRVLPASLSCYPRDYTT